ncbi:FAD-binding monooxygenase [Streptomyces sp. DSM 41886]|uniref:FAD-binding monooxygenase n=2 Tax=Streptomyces johnsoniae TaxID=3075532 RepID=A0ABU2S5K4_9ACTN|nr:FAD-binding monooxygenase [Streptomyces sp. DSM 41886]MDT0444248.1 FAD-binding monooxygenase [Streptomyces sp. DSM 41886]
MGGGMAGLLAARVLSDAFTDVTVVDRDVLAGVEGPRRGVPQGRQAHGLQARGLAVIEELLPGITEEMVKDGAPLGDMTANVRLIFDGERIRNSPSGLMTLTLSRPFLERHVRARVQVLPNVTFRERLDVCGLVTAAGASRVTGVRVRAAGGGAGGGGAEEVLPADLVVDATGRGSRTPVWLREFGYSEAAVDRLDVRLGYATRQYRMARDTLERGECEIAVVASVESPRGAMCVKTEDDLLMVVVNGMLGDHPPTDPDGFLEFVRSLQAPDAYEAIKDLDPVGPPVGHRFPANLRRRYERLRRFPRGLVLLGDSVCSLNPAYAQGMTVAALGALVLRDHVADGRLPRPRPYFRDLARRAVGPAWRLTTSADLAFPGVVGPRPPAVRLGHAYVRRLQVAARYDEEVARAYLRVVALVSPASSLMRPAVLWRVLRASRGGSRAGRAA